MFGLLDRSTPLSGPQVITLQRPVDLVDDAAGLSRLEAQLSPLLSVIAGMVDFTAPVSPAAGPFPPEDRPPRSHKLDENSADRMGIEAVWIDEYRKRKIVEHRKNP